MVSSLMGFDGCGLYPYAMTDNESVYPKLGSGYALRKEINDKLIDAFNIQSCKNVEQFLEGNSTIQKSQFLNIRQFWKKWEM